MCIVLIFEWIFFVFLDWSRDQLRSISVRNLLTSHRNHMTLFHKKIILYRIWLNQEPHNLVKLQTLLQLWRWSEVGFRIESYYSVCPKFFQFSIQFFLFFGTMPLTHPKVRFYSWLLEKWRLKHISSIPKEFSCDHVQ